MVEMMEYTTKVRVEAKPTPHALQPVSGAVAEEREDDDINIDSSKGIEVPPIIADDQVMEEAQPDQEEMEPAADIDFNDEVKARAWDALNL